MTIPIGNRIVFEVDRSECRNQLDRIEEMQRAIHRAGRLMDAIACDHLEAPEARNAAYFAALALEFIAIGQAEDASAFMARLCAGIRDDHGPSDTEHEGDDDADHE